MAVSMRASQTAKAARASRAARPVRANVVCKAQKVQFGQAAAAIAAATALVAGSANAITFDELQGLTYLQVKGSGIANTCPVIEGGSSKLSDLKAGSYKMENFCIEPTSFMVKEESQFKGGETDFVQTRLLTRLTYTLDGMSGTVKVGADGTAELKEEEGLDFAATTIQLPGGERVPFLFSIKQLDAKGPLDAMKGDFQVPSYRGSTFMDPKGRGGSTGYDNAIALPARADDEHLLKENIKVVKGSKGSAVFSVAKVDPVTGEIAGVFESAQLADNDMGAKPAKDLKITGLWYAQLK